MSMRDIYRKIARENGVTVKEVKEEMQKAIDEGWANPNLSTQNIEMQRSIRPDGKTPTPEEVIKFCSSQVQKSK